MAHRLGLEKRSLFLLSAFITLVSCTKLISDEFPDFDKVPTANALLIAGESIKVHVSFAEKIDTTYLTVINNAEVIITTDQGDIDTLKFVSNGSYRSVLIAKPGLTYSLEVSIDGYDKIRGSDSVPKRVYAKITDHTNYYRYNEEGNFMEATEIEFYDDPNTVDFYEVVLLKKEHSDNYYVYPYNDNSPIILNEGFEPYSTSSLVFSDQLFRDSIIRIYLDYYQGQHIRGFGNDSLVQIFDEHTMILELRHVSEDYYNYKKSFYFYSMDRYPGFVEGTASYYPIYSNMEKGLGMISAYSITRDSIWIPQEQLPL